MGWVGVLIAASAFMLYTLGQVHSNSSLGPTWRGEWVQNAWEFATNPIVTSYDERTIPDLHFPDLLLCPSNFVSPPDSPCPCLSAKVMGVQLNVSRARELGQSTELANFYARPLAAVKGDSLLNSRTWYPPLSPRSPSSLSPLLLPTRALTLQADGEEPPLPCTHAARLARPATHHHPAAPPEATVLQRPSTTSKCPPPEASQRPPAPTACAVIHGRGQ